MIIGCGRLSVKSNHHQHCLDLMTVLPINNANLHFPDEESKGKREKGFALSHVIQAFAFRYGMVPHPSFSLCTLNAVPTRSVSAVYRECGLLG